MSKLHPKHEEYRVELYKMENCMLLAMLNYEANNPKRGEYYLDLAKQYFTRTAEDARKRLPTLQGSAA